MRRVVAMLGFIAFALSAPAVARAQTTVSVEGTVVTITVPIFVAGMVDYGNFRNLETGQRDTPEAVAEKLAAFIEEIWNEGFAKFRYRDCLTFRLDVSIKPGGTRERSSDRHNIHYNNNPGTRSTVWDPEASNHTDDTSSAYTTDLGGEWGPPSGVWAHEVGHLLGLGDDYEDVLDENGKAVGSTPAPGRGGTIMDGGDQIDQALVDRIGKLIEKTGVKIPECWKGTMESDTTPASSPTRRRFESQSTRTA